MNVLLLGSGGREHAIAWKIAQSLRLSQLYILPGNPGTAQHGINLAGDPLDVQAVLQATAQYAIDLVVVGPEAPLEVGISDAVRASGVPVFGPTQAGALLETSKAYAKDFMQEFAIPTAQYAVFEDFESAVSHLEQIAYPYVIKASGLAAGKGVFLPDSTNEAKDILKEIMQEKRFGLAGEKVVIEERLSGSELSVLVFTDGERIAIMPPAQDHKRLLNNDEGPNTGGMGVFAPSPYATPGLMEMVEEQILQPTLAGLKARGIDYRGVLYAGLILTAEGPKVLEYNCRFGDPETQVILPLMESDLLEVLYGAARRELPQVIWIEEHAVCVVLASYGYPEAYQKSLPITGIEMVSNGYVFQAGTSEKDGQLVTNGGRVLGVTAVSNSLADAACIAYQEVKKIHFDKMHYRTDIGTSVSAYSQAGVDISAGNQATELMKDSVKSTYGPEVLAGIGAFGGLYDADALQEMSHPVLVASTDGVGTKVILAAQSGRLANIGRDIVNHCINDILVQGARPLFFLDYFAASKLEPAQVAEVVSGIADACREAGCALLGGETAEMPGVYHTGHFDVAGTIVGVVEKENILPKANIQAGDVLVGLPSSGPHTNGYSLIRKVFSDVDLKENHPMLGQPLGDALLAPHTSYFSQVWPVLQDKPELIKALAHVTGGGFVENLPRVLHDGLSAAVNLSGWDVPPLFRLIQQMGVVSEMEMYRVFNMGIGMVAVTNAAHAEALINALGDGQVIGEVIEGNEVQLVR